MAEKEWGCILLGIFIGAMLIYFLTRKRVTQLKRDESGMIIEIVEMPL